jgi:hypothetical protein
VRGSTKLTLTLLAGSGLMIASTYGVIWLRHHGGEATPKIDYNPYFDQEADPAFEPAIRRLEQIAKEIGGTCVLDEQGREAEIGFMGRESLDAPADWLGTHLAARREVRSAMRELWSVIDLPTLTLPLEPRPTEPGELAGTIPQLGMFRYVSTGRRIEGLLCNDAVFAAIDGDALTCELNLLGAAQSVRLSQHNRGAVGALSHAFVMRNTSETLVWVLTHHAGMVSDAGLGQIACALGTLGEPIVVDIEGERASTLDWMQRRFTDDGRGNGRITAAGFREFLQISDHPDMAWYRTTADEGPEWLMSLAAPLGALRLGSRAEELRAHEQSWAAMDALTRRPTHTWTSEQTVQAAVPSSPITSAQAAASALDKVAITVRTAVMQRDGALVAIALELYRREHGGWPASLDALVPMYLPKVPMDEFSGKPMRYEVRGGVPWVWGVGGDMDDDRGTRPAERYTDDLVARWYGVGNTSDLTPKDGDWILFPAR